MKKTLLFAISAFLSISLLAQEEKEVVTGAGYANDVFYSLRNGTVATVPRDNWDIAFISQIMSVSVLANNGAGVEVYTYPDGTIDDWATLDSASIDWTSMQNSPMYNSIYSFDSGAFIRNIIPDNLLDQGWGVYNEVNHKITGDSLFIIKTVSGAYKKLAIVEKAAMANTWEFKYANLDGSNEQTVPLEANNYISKYFIPYSLDSMKVQDQEPAMADWDLLFTRYYDYNIPYIVTGVLINDHHIVAQEVRESGMDQATHMAYEDASFTSIISEIGSDWKNFNMGTFSYELVDTVVYYLKTYGGATDSSYFKLYFTGFSGSADGKYTFMQEKISLLSAEEYEISSLLEVYPNPARDRIHVVFDQVGQSQIDIIDMTGRRVRSTPYDAGGFTNLSVDVSSLTPGIYFVRVSTEGTSDVLRFIKE